MTALDRGGRLSLTHSQASNRQDLSDPCMLTLRLLNDACSFGMFDHLVS